MYYSTDNISVLCIDIIFKNISNYGLFILTRLSEILRFNTYNLL